MDTLNFDSTRMYTVLAYNYELHAKNEHHRQNLLLFLVQCHYTKIAQRIFKYSDIQYTSLTLDKILNSLIYRMLFYVNIYESYELLKTVRVFFGPPYICPMYYAVEMCGEWVSNWVLRVTQLLGRDVRTHIFRHLHLHHCVCLPRHSLAKNSRTFQDQITFSRTFQKLEILQKESRTFQEAWECCRCNWALDSLNWIELNHTFYDQTVLGNRTYYTLIWYAFYDLRSGNEVGPILTARSPHGAVISRTVSKLLCCSGKIITFDRASSI